LSEHAILVQTHGRYLVEPAARDSASLLVGCHGYAESADIQLRRLQGIEGADAWRLVSIQGLHRFYQRRSDAVVASWMTRQDRHLAIADNQAYVAAVVEAEWAKQPRVRGVVLAGFSQGVATAFRAAVTLARPVLGVIAAGGDVPPELQRDRLARIPRVLVCRGEGDEWYTSGKLSADREKLAAAGVAATVLEHPGGHDWTEAVSAAAAAFLRECLA